MLSWLQRVWARQTGTSISAKGGLAGLFVAFVLSPDGSAWVAETIGAQWVPLVTLLASALLGRGSKPSPPAEPAALSFERPR